MKRLMFLCSLTLGFGAVAFGQQLDHAGALDSQGDPVYRRVSQDATFPGGEKAFQKFLKKNQAYPKAAMRDKEEGVVVVDFVIEKDGSISQPEATVFISFKLASAAEDLVKESPKWKPAMLDGKPVSQRMSWLIRYDRDNFDKDGKRK